MKLDGQVALVTGSAVRVGAAIVRELHAHGASVAIHFRNSSDAAAALASELNEKREDSATIYQADLNDIDRIPELIDAIAAWKDRLDIVVNNASSFFPTPLGTITEAQWDDLVGSNMKAPLFIAQAAAPHLKAARGNLINIVDVHSKRPLDDHLVYSPAKTALAMQTLGLAKELGPEVRVNGVSPGAILWPVGGLSDAEKQKILDDVPLGRPGTPEDVAGCVRFLVADAPYISGQIIAVDGGLSAAW